MGVAGMSEHHRGWREAPRTKSRLHERRVGVGTPRQETGETGSGQVMIGSVVHARQVRFDL